MASDRGTVPLSGTAIVTILIDDINDSRPEFLNPIQTVSVLESAEPGTVIANVTAVDRDVNPKLEYHIIGIVAKDDTDRLVPDQEDAFAVNINTGTKACSPPALLLTPCPVSWLSAFSLTLLLAALSLLLPTPQLLLPSLFSLLLTPRPSLSLPSLPWLFPSLPSLLPSPLTSFLIILLYQYCMSVPISPHSG